MGNDLRNLPGLHAIVQRQVEMIRHFDGLIACDECRQRYYAAVVANGRAPDVSYIAKQAVSG